MEYVKEDYLLGNKKIIVGDKLHDLVLENLGKIYIRYGNSYKEFNAIINSINSASTSAGIVTIVDGITSTDTFTNGIFIFDSRSKSLYLSYRDELLLLAESVDVNNSRYVQKSGDTMTGQLEITEANKPPLIVRSYKCVKNLNSNFLEGYSSDELAKKSEDETISGDWNFIGENTFDGKTTFNETAVFERGNGNAAIRVTTGNIITDGSLGSSVYVSGMTGSGWRLDASTNTLEIDNLIVRGVLNVFELVVNKISATNGSFWITDSFKINKIREIVFIDCDSVTNYTFKKDVYYIPYSASSTIFNKNSSISTIDQEIRTHNIIKYSADISELATRDARATESKTHYMPFFMFRVINEKAFNSVLISEGTTYSISDLCNYDVLSGLITQDLIDRVNLFQKDVKNISEYEILSTDSNDILITPFDLNFLTQTYSIVPINYISNNEICSAVVCDINLYHKYFGDIEKLSDNIYVIEAEDDEYSAFKPGDIVRCQKYTNGCVAQYNAIVLGLAGSNGVIIQLQNSTSTIEKTNLVYDSDGNLLAQSSTTESDSSSYSNTLQYQKLQAEAKNAYLIANPNADLEDSGVLEEAELFVNEYIETRYKSFLGTKPTEKDALVRIGSIFKGDRQNSMYLTSSSDNSPYQDVMTDVNRPDYSVNYFTPVYKETSINSGSYANKTLYVQNQEYSNMMNIYWDVYDECNDWNDDWGNQEDWETAYLAEAETLYNNAINLGIINGSYTWASKVKTNKYDLISTKLSVNTKVRLGNLSGIYNENLQKQPSGYGLYGENVYLTGSFYLENGRSLVDIDRDVTLGTGGTLDQMKDQLDSISGEGLEQNISNFINTNKNSTLRIGLDYSLWALGNAGISIINPNAKYKTTTTTEGKTYTEVDPNTVGDGDEYIVLQGSKVVIKTTKEAEDGRIAVICTTVNPNTWKYENSSSIYCPKYISGSTLTDVPFFLGYVWNLDNIYTVDDNLGRKYVAFCNKNHQNYHKSKTSNGTEYYDSHIVADGNFTSIIPENTDEYDIYSFDSYYESSDESVDVKAFIPENTTVYVMYHYYQGKTYQYYDSSKLFGDKTIYYIPVIVTSGLFKGDKFNAKLIEAENLVAVDEGSEYIKNPKFSPKLEISDSNYPVIKQDSDGLETIDKNGNFVVISGTTGKITAKGADIRGDITVGEEIGSHINLRENNSAPYLALMDGESTLLNVSGATDTNPTQIFKEGSGEINTSGNFSLSVNPGYNRHFYNKNYLNDTSSPELLKDHSAEDWSTVKGTKTLDSYSTTNKIYVKDKTIKYNLSAANGEVNIKNFIGGVVYSKDYADSSKIQTVDLNYTLNPGYTVTIKGNIPITFSAPTFNEKAIGKKEVTLKTELLIYKIEDGVEKYNTSISLNSLKYSITKKIIKVKSWDSSYRNGLGALVATYSYYDFDTSSSDNIGNLIAINKIIQNTSVYSWKFKLKITLSSEFDADLIKRELDYYDGVLDNEITSQNYIFKLLVLDPASSSDPMYADTWFPFEFSTSVSVHTSCTIGDISLSYDTAKYSSAIFGNGQRFGYDGSNYFSTYYISNSGMAFDARFGTVGMYFDKNKWNYYYGNKVMPMNIPILQGMLVYTPKITTSGSTTTTHNYFRFFGNTILGSTTSLPPTYTTTKNQIKVIKIKALNDTSTTLVSNYDNHDVSYYPDLDLCIVSIGKEVIQPSDVTWNGTLGAILIFFGTSWNCTFNNTTISTLIGGGICTLYGNPAIISSGGIIERDSQDYKLITFADNTTFSFNGCLELLIGHNQGIPTNIQLLTTYWSK